VDSQKSYLFEYDTMLLVLGKLYDFLLFFDISSCEFCAFITLC